MSPRIPVHSNQRSRDERSNDRRTSNECGQASTVFLSTRQTAGLLHVSHVTLARWRIEGQGPAYLKAGRRVLYDCAVVIAWVNAQRRQSTSEVGREHTATTTTELRSTEWYRKNGWR